MDHDARFAYDDAMAIGVSSRLVVYCDVEVWGE